MLFKLNMIYKQHPCDIFFPINLKKKHTYIYLFTINLKKTYLHTFIYQQKDKIIKFLFKNKIILFFIKFLQTYTNNLFMLFCFFKNHLLLIHFSLYTFAVDNENNMFVLNLFVSNKLQHVCS